MRLTGVKSGHFQVHLRNVEERDDCNGIAHCDWVY